MTTRLLGCRHRAVGVSRWSLLNSFTIFVWHREKRLRRDKAPPWFIRPECISCLSLRTYIRTCTQRPHLIFVPPVNDVFATRNYFYTAAVLFRFSFFIFYFFSLCLSSRLPCTRYGGDLWRGSTTRRGDTLERIPRLEDETLLNPFPLSPFFPRVASLASRKTRETRLHQLRTSRFLREI